MKNQNTKILRPIRVLDQWNLYKASKSLFLIQTPNKELLAFEEQEEAEKFMLYGFFDSKDSHFKN